MYQKAVLDNGLRIITSHMPQARSVSLVFFIGAGPRYESHAEAGISHFIEHLHFKGTKQRPTSKDIVQPIESVGGFINGGTDKEVTSYYSKVPKSYFALALDVLTDMLLHSTLSQENIERERRIIIEEINASLDTPQLKVDRLIDELLWPDQPLGRDIAGSKETVASLTRKQMLDFISHRYLANNVVVSVAGDIHHEEVLTNLKETLGNWGSGDLLAGYTTDNTQTAPRFKVEVQETEQAHLCLALRGLSIFHPDRFALDLLNIVLGEGMSSRLFVEIRERRGLAYDIHSYVSHFLDSGSLIIYAGVNPNLVRETVEAILSELSKLKEGIPEKEVSKAKEMAKGRLLLRLEDTRNVAGWLGIHEILTQKPLTIDEITAIIDALEPENLKRLSQKLITTEKLCLAIVGPVKETGLENLLKL